MEDQNVFEVVTQVFTFVRSQYSHRKTNQCPHVDHRVIAAVVFAQFMNLGVAVVASGNAVIRAGGLDLVVLEFAVFQAFFLEARLQEPAAAAAAVVVGTVGLHVDEVFFADHRLDHEAQVFGNGVAEALAYDLTGVLYGKLDLQILVPIGIDLELAFADPFGVVFIDIFYLKIMLEVELFQSCQD